MVVTVTVAAAVVVVVVVPVMAEVVTMAVGRAHCAHVATQRDPQCPACKDSYMC